MNVEIGTEAAQFLEKEYINGIFVLVQPVKYKCFLPKVTVDGSLQLCISGKAASTASPCTLIKKKIKFSSYLRKFRVEQLQSHICMRKGFLICEEMRKYFPIYEEAV
jgi:hypothetical protein